LVIFSESYYFYLQEHVEFAANVNKTIRSAIILRERQAIPTPTHVQPLNYGQNIPVWNEPRVPVVQVGQFAQVCTNDFFF
jgi:hypothetical protein